MEETGVILARFLFQSRFSPCSEKMSLGVQGRCPCGNSISTTPLYQNTYRLESKRPFNPHLVESIIKEVVNRNCAGLLYDATLCPKLVTTMATTIRQKVKDLNFERYKLLVLVQIGEKKLQGVASGVRFLWDAKRDSYATFTYENNSLFVTAICLGIYHE